MPDPKGAFTWYELLTTDADAAQAFYTDVVGWKIGDSGMPGMDYRFVHAGDTPVGGLMQLSDEMLAGGARPIWLGYVEAGNVDAAIDRIEAAGGKTLVPATDIPDVGRFAMLADPQGVLLYIMQSTSRETSRAFEPGTIEIGSYCYLSNASLVCARGITIGERCFVAGGVTIADSDFHPLDPAARLADTIALSPRGDRRHRPEVGASPVVIGDDVWIGFNATIL
ncbi:MAG: VOC family protein, partial [Gammaproteobacteria bacterium]|nr:VOC family protein [Gammaproteobacteria bacterium]